MVGIIFNHDMFDDPYKQSAVKKGFKELEDFLIYIEERVFYSFSPRRRSSFFGDDMEDDYVIVQHTYDLSYSEKQTIAELIRDILTVKKTAYKNEVPETLIVFEKKDTEDCFYFNSSREQIEL